MRNHFLSLFRLALIVLVFLTFSNCEKDEIVQLEEEQTVQTILDFEAKNVSGQKLFQENKDLDRHISATFLNDDAREDNLNSAIYGVSINTSNVQVISGETFDSYTFIANREEATPYVLENYILTIFDDGGYTQMLVTYPYVVTNGEIEYIFTQATAQYIVDDNLLLGESESPCPSTSEEIIAWEDGGCNAVNCGLAGDHSPGEACEDGVVRAHWNCTGAWGVTGCVYTGGGMYTGTTDPSNNTTNGGGINTSSNPFNYPPTIPIVPKIQTLLGIDGITLEMNEWLEENLDFKIEMEKFLIEENQYENTDLEIRLMIQSESSDVLWTPYIGSYNNIPSLGYTHIRHLTYPSGHNYTEFKLTSGDIILAGDFGTPFESNEGTYYYSKDIKRLFKIPDPNNYDPVNLDFLWNSFWSTVQTGVRYCTPLEDVVILIDGKDFDGVESSRAVAGIFILIDIVPGGKVLHITKKAGTVIANAAPILWRISNTIYKTQKRIAKKYKGIIANMSNTRKGNWGEMVTDTDLIEKGYKEVHVNRVTDIDHGGHDGIDHIFKNEQTGEYIIVESKYGTSGMNPADLNTGLPRQMSDEWISNGTRSAGDRLYDAVGGDDALYDAISNGYQRVKAKIQADGSVVYSLIGDDGYSILGNAGVYTP